MEFDSKLQEDIVTYFNNREDFYFYKKGGGTFFFHTWKYDEEERYIIDSKKPHGDKTMISAEVFIYSNLYPERVKKFGVEMKIEMYMWGYQEQVVVFEGWVENIKELKIICKAVGL